MAGGSIDDVTAKAINAAATFKASFPAIQSAIKLGDDGMRITLDIPESEMANALALIAMRNQVLSVTIAVEKQGKALEIVPKRSQVERYNHEDTQ
jgi:hypothetical protein